MFNDYTLKQLADARRGDLLREAEMERLARMVQTTKGPKAARPNLFLALAAGGAVLAALFIAVMR